VHEEMDDALPRMVSPGRIAALDREATPTKALGKIKSRSNSTPKRRLLALAMLDAQSSNVNLQESRTLSRRRQRRYDNSNFFGVALPGEAKAEDIWEAKRHLHSHFQLHREFTSAIGTLFANESYASLEYIRSCRDGMQISSHIASKRVITSEDEVAWLQIEKRLRSVVQTAVTRGDDDLLTFIGAMERIVLTFAIDQQCPRDLHPCLLSKFASPPVVDPRTKALVISLVDSSFHRLLLHVICQFYSLKSAVSHPSLLFQSFPVFLPHLSLYFWVVSTKNM
jgi:hypothetical protein